VKRSNRTTSKAAVAEEAWRALFEFFISTRRERDPSLAKYGLTPNDGKALFTLDAATGKTMGTLAAEWTCDASNATWIVDRLEKRGFAERRPSPADRRVKMVVLTPLGVKVREDVMTQFFKPPALLLDLERSELEAFRDVARKLRAMISPPQESAASG
jgi:DNA-binding MarR family transcriptional regulator